MKVMHEARQLGGPDEDFVLRALIEPLAGAGHFAEALRLADATMLRARFNGRADLMAALKEAVLVTAPEHNGEALADRWSILEVNFWWLPK